MIIIDPGLDTRVARAILADELLKSKLINANQLFDLMTFGKIDSSVIIDMARKLRKSIVTP